MAVVDHTIEELQPPAYEGIDCPVSGMFIVAYLCVCFLFSCTPPMHPPSFHAPHTNAHVIYSVWNTWTLPGLYLELYLELYMIFAWTLLEPYLSFT